MRERRKGSREWEEGGGAMEPQSVCVRGSEGRGVGVRKISRVIVGKRD